MIFDSIMLGISESMDWMRMLFINGPEVNEIGYLEDVASMAGFSGCSARIDQLRNMFMVMDRNVEHPVETSHETGALRGLIAVPNDTMGLGWLRASCVPAW